ncbi:MAG TPA: sterol desaturase family protein [Saprospiraceae bacterium]|nr:sterol desaturase family protein [Saprospiraceae bacterium]
MDLHADKYSWQQLWNMDLPPIILYAAPVMFALVALEWYIQFYRKGQSFDGKDLMASTLIGIGNIISTAITKIFTFYLVWLTYYYVAPITIPATWWSGILCLIGIDFARYWAHRVAHEQRFWWATHVPHHSSEQYYFGVSFRLSWVQQLKVFFFLPVAAIGFDPIVFFICHQIEVLYQFWIHTEYIKKLPRPIEYIFTTPSHHRVHHATNPQYIDKNYGSTLIIWDRIFGTFEPEVEKPVYGITQPVDSYNPVKLVFHEFGNMIRDMRKTPGLVPKFKLLFSLPGSVYDRHKNKFVREEGINS